MTEIYGEKKVIFFEFWSKLDPFGINTRFNIKIKVYIRSVADNIQSEAEQVKVVCGEPVSTGKMCLAKAPKATNVDLGRNNVEINLGKFFEIGDSHFGDITMLVIQCWRQNYSKIFEMLVTDVVINSKTFFVTEFFVTHIGHQN